MKFEWSDILEIGVPENKNNEIEDLCVKTFKVSPHQARDKIVVCGTE